MCRKILFSSRWIPKNEEYLIPYKKIKYYLPDFQRGRRPRGFKRNF